MKGGKRRKGGKERKDGDDERASARKNEKKGRKSSHSY